MCKQNESEVEFASLVKLLQELYVGLPQEEVSEKTDSTCCGSDSCCQNESEVESLDSIDFVANLIESYRLKGYSLESPVMQYLYGLQRYYAAAELNEELPVDEEEQATEEVDSFTVDKLDYGYLVTFGEKEYAVEDEERLLQLLTAYIKNPEGI